jgi:FtsP/CotA-like multicopper oxidase with cupredoxin domain
MERRDFLKNAVVNANKIVEVDFTADNPENTLFHCHQQLHMDFGFMAVMTYAGGSHAKPSVQV